ncbi:TPA: SGNH/GDSL hydrolase family protein [Escherichia coli]|uniref:SGNH/GDSL hydrolase family protein n=2 Tax=Escherichia coli TaxID=562 RepID=UPI000BDE6487|nr:SGNH/GDSL hydrolase family protein [Escherichia coli]EFH4015152.1 SGNH/GDSL hydrolase family protein [Escherichia coli]EFJ2449853.1 SGNH/GDSL hydrolase family protein [Escherichia coli]EFO0655736.1 SGNH/GDSL hydrolase family protein [Escherichia coli]EFO0676604.1 SGNH/GDSL hydrolase family protein [Escherichia coli]EHM0715188.1 SGNH/GDSL hydrolase family protein [Escherichia coli]
MMKSYIFLLTCLPMTGWAQEGLIPNESGLSFFQETTNKINKIKLSQAPNKSILMFGDSITQAMNQNNLHFSSVNLGTGGERVESIFKRIKETDIQKYDGVYISGGSNNFLHGESGVQVGEKIAEAVVFTAAKAKHVYVTGVLVPNLKLNPQVQNNFKDANSIIKSTCKKYKNCEFINIPSEIVGKDGNNLNYTIEDGIHLNKEGYSLLKENLNKKMADFPVNYYYKFTY